MNLSAIKNSLVAIALALTLSGCSVNPVTGENQLSLIGESQELAMGAEQYVPTQQTQEHPTHFHLVCLQPT